MSYGLTCQEVERVDSAYRSTLSVQSSLVMGPINEFGSESLKQKYLPSLATGELVGCFGLTEPDAGSDPAAMKTTCTKLDHDGMWEISGSKTWISHSPVADVFIIWCRHYETGKIKGFVLDRKEHGKGTLKSVFGAGFLLNFKYFDIFRFSDFEFIAFFKSDFIRFCIFSIFMDSLKNVSESDFDRRRF